MDMPTPCERCNELFDLLDGAPSPRNPQTERKIIICARCADKEQEEVDREEEIQELKDVISDAEYSLKAARARLMELDISEAGSVPRNQYVYWIAYHFGDGSRNSFGGRRIFSPVQGNSTAWLESVRTWIQDQSPALGTVLIINWQRLEGDEQWDKPEPEPSNTKIKVGHHDDA